MAQLAKPDISVLANGIDIIVSGLEDENASGWKVRLGTIRGRGAENIVYPAADGAVFLEDCRPSLSYFVQAMAVGDGGDYTDSDWSDAAEVTTGGEVDEAIPVPVLASPEVTFTSAAFTGFRTDFGIRWQVVAGEGEISAADCRFGGCDSAGMAMVLGLRPGTAYKARARYVRGAKVGAWSEVVSFSSETPTASAVVTTTANTGAGSLRAALTGAADGTRITFDSSLAGETITLFSVVDIASKKIVIDGSGLASPVTISGAFSNNATKLHVIGLILDGTRTRGHFVDCSLTGSDTSAFNIYSSCRCYVSKTLTSSNTTILASNTVHDSDFFDQCSAAGGLSNSAVCVGCIFTGQTARAAGLGASSFSGCVITGNSSAGSGIFTGSGRLVETDIFGNTLTGANYRVVGASEVYSSRIFNNTCACANAPAYDGTAETSCFDSYFSGNTGTSSDEVGTGNFVRCVIQAAAERAVSSGSPVFRDCLILGTASGTAVNCTASVFSGSADNCLLGPLSSASGTANIYWDELDSGSEYFVDKIFRAADFGDYRLAANSPAFDAGDDSFVEEGELDLDGNPRSALDHVDVGCYELAVYRLAAPSFSILLAPGGQGTVLFFLPAGASAFLLQYADNVDFTGARVISSASAAIALTGLEGTVYFRAKAVGIPLRTVDSYWSAVQDAYFDAAAPIVIVDDTPIEITVGDEFNPLDGVTVTDDSGAECTLHWCVYYDEEPVEVDGEVIDQRISGVSAGIYALVISAADPAGNVGTATRELRVLLPKLPTPVISADVDGTGAVVVSGLTGENVSSWWMNVNGEIAAVVPDSAGRVRYEHLRPNATYAFRAKALADQGYRDSEWSAAVSVFVEGDILSNILEAVASEVTRALAAAGVSAAASVDFFPRSDAAAADELAVTVTPRDISNQQAARGAVRSELVVDIGFTQKLAASGVDSRIKQLSKVVEKVFSALAYKALSEYPDANCVEIERGLFNYDMALSQRVFAATVSATYVFHYKLD